MKNYDKYKAAGAQIEVTRVHGDDRIEMSLTYDQKSPLTGEPTGNKASAKTFHLEDLQIEIDRENEVIAEAKEKIAGLKALQVDAKVVHDAKKAEIAKAKTAPPAETTAAK